MVRSSLLVDGRFSGLRRGSAQLPSSAPDRRRLAGGGHGRRVLGVPRRALLLGQRLAGFIITSLKVLSIFRVEVGSEKYEKLKVTPVGLGARDTLRLEMNYALYGMDISRSINPIEAGLGWITSFNKGHFIGRDALLLKKNEDHKRRISFEMLERAVPRHNYDIIIDGTLNLPSSMQVHSSQLYAKNISTFRTHMMKEGNLNIDLDDEIISGSMFTHQGKITHEPTQQAVDNL